MLPFLLSRSRHSHMGLSSHADTIEKATLGTIAEGKHITRDLGGKAGTKEYTDAILSKI